LGSSAALLLPEFNVRKVRPVKGMVAIAVFIEMIEALFGLCQIRLMAIFNQIGRAHV